MSKKYLVLCNRHNSIFGREWGLFWGYREREGGYNSDLRTAHRFDESEIHRFNDNRDIPIPIDVLGIPEECEDEKTINENIKVMIERGTLNNLLDLDLRSLHQVKQYCSNCGEEL
ncbi:hypothetical protein [Clostridium botulinum]|uniref:hypothetical protein n=1 Tax=Clostridium botulinum TaxID=1491 RepID=UPI001C9B335F|nr:hypothetical protein [Clostridium botulinum]MBY6842664.1 hypothetical protein [Clostridium botulinum]